MFIFQVDCDGLTDSAINYLCERCPQLSHFNLQGVCFIGDEALKNVIKRGRLRSLNLAETSITDEGLKQLAENNAEQVLILYIGTCTCSL